MDLGNTKKGQDQHFVPVFVQKEWLRKDRPNPKSVDVIFKNSRTSRFTINSVRMDNNFCGEGLWSLSPNAPGRTFAEDNPFRLIDQRASDIWKKIKTNEPLSCNELEDLALFLNSILYRQPEMIRTMRSTEEKGLNDMDSDLHFIQDNKQV